MRYISFLLSAVLILPAALPAHDLEVTVLQGGITIQVASSHEAPIVDARVRIFSPESNSMPYQTGTTDETGRFMFVPDTTGTWRVEIHDGASHPFVENIHIAENLQPSVAADHGGIWQKAVIGVSILFGLTGVAFYYSARRQLNDLREGGGG